MPAAVFPDNTVLCNFAAVHRLNLLEGWLSGHGHWTEAVAEEARRSSSYLPDLGALFSGRWLGEPIEVAAPEDIKRVEHLRRDVFGGTAAAPLKHLGEAQTCFVLKEFGEWAGSTWVSDDRDSLDFARFQGFTSLETIDVMRGIVANGDLTARQALDLMESMVAADRAIRMPTRVGDLTA